MAPGTWSSRKKYVGIAIGASGLCMLLFTLVRNIAITNRLQGLLPELPSVSLDYGESPYNHSKVALLIDNRPLGILAPLIIHFISVLPSDWRFRFMGSEASVETLAKSAAIRRHVKIGKLDLTLIPANMTVDGREELSQFLTNLWLYETVLKPAEWLLVFQTDSMICAKYGATIDDWLQYDWVGAPYPTGFPYHSNGGLSLRRVSSIVSVLQHQQRRENSTFEDIWLSERLAHLPNSKVANSSEGRDFSVGYVWHDAPLGYHTGGSGTKLHSNIWGSQEHRQQIYDYCPEMKITLKMDASHYMPELCHSKR